MRRCAARRCAAQRTHAARSTAGGHHLRRAHVTQMTWLSLAVHYLMHGSHAYQTS